MTLTLVTPPSGALLHLDEVKQHLKVEHNEEDAYLHGLNAAAERHVEGVTGRQLLTATYDYSGDIFPDYRSPLILPLSPLLSVTEVSYVDSAGATQIMTPSDYIVTPGLDNPRLRLGYGASWPSVRDQEDAYTVRFVAGYGGPNQVPAPIKQAMLLLIGHWYANREAVNVVNIVNALPFSVAALLQPYRKYR